MFSRRMLMYCVVIGAVSADPRCSLDTEDRTHIICINNKKDYVLTRGLISANNRIVKATLRGCRITDIDDEAFLGLPSLTHIDLSDNKLTQIKVGALDDARKVIDINLSNNQLTGFLPGFFDKKENLIKLDLKRNSIENLQPGIFHSLSKLKSLDLSSNEILGMHLDSHIFDQNPQISFISFSRNNMAGTNDELLQAFQAIEELHLEECMLDEVPPFATRENLKTMKNLLLTKNRLTQIENPKTFVALESLELLHMDFNNLSSIHEEVFQPLQKLKFIGLSNNRLQFIPASLFTNMRSLVLIDLANNFITFIPVNAFRGTSVRSLNLSNNRFTYLTDNFCLELKNTGAQIQKFYFDDNPWQCMCLLDVLKEVNKFGIAYKKLRYNGARAVCVSEELVCKRQESVNQIYVDLYDERVRNVPRGI